MNRDWNDTAREYPRKCIHTLFAEQALRTPEAVAIEYEGTRVTYRELDRRSNQLARVLASHGIEREARVGIWLDRSADMLLAMLGVLKSGASYVPLDIAWPRERVQWVLGNLAVPCVVTQQAQREAMRDLGSRLPTLATVLYADVGTDDLSAEPANGAGSHAMTELTRWHLEHTSEAPFEDRSRPDDIAYIIHTSGSTGTPKGVVVRHAPVVNLIDWVNRTFEVGTRDRLLFVTSICFDLSVYDVFGILAAGGTVRVATSREIRDPARLLEILDTEAITFWDSAPAALQQLASRLERHQGGGALRLVFLSGDWIPVTLPDVIRRCVLHGPRRESRRSDRGDRVVELLPHRHGRTRLGQHPLWQANPECALSRLE